MKRIALLIPLIMAACAGTQFHWDAARQIQPGMASKDVMALIGQPYLVQARGDSVLYVWAYADLMAGSRSLSIEFRDDKVVKAPPIPAGF